MTPPPPPDPEAGASGAISERPPPPPKPQRTRATGTTVRSPCVIGPPKTAWTPALEPTSWASRSRSWSLGVEAAARSTCLWTASLVLAMSGAPLHLRGSIVTRLRRSGTSRRGTLRRLPSAWIGFTRCPRPRPAERLDDPPRPRPLRPHVDHLGHPLPADPGRRGRDRAIRAGPGPDGHRRRDPPADRPRPR